ncbi:MAG TPA: hypothetical protein VKU91_03065 [Acidimicrobiales bacterium]|nr:hypothetical protein [Acidimicrobiales bacterium]
MSFPPVPPGAAPPAGDPPSTRAAPPPEEPRRRWGLYACTHGVQGGWVDESARRLSHQEVAVARLLAAEGHRVRSLAEWPWLGPTSDLEACRLSVEVKSFLSVGDHPSRRPPTPESLCNKLIKASSQGEVAIIWGVGSGLSRRVAEDGVALFASQPGRRRLGQVRVVGNGFDLAWRGPQLSRVQGLPEPPRRRIDTGLGL